MFFFRACLDIREAPAFWGKMAYLEEEAAKSPDKEDNITLPQFASTHPSSENRQKKLSELLPEAHSLRNACGCGRLYGPDPNLTLAAMAAWAREVRRVQQPPKITTIRIEK